MNFPVSFCLSWSAWNSTWDFPLCHHHINTLICLPLQLVIYLPNSFQDAMGRTCCFVCPCTTSAYPLKSWHAMFPFSDPLDFILKFPVTRVKPWIVEVCGKWFLTSVTVAGYDNSPEDSHPLGWDCSWIAEQPRKFSSRVQAELWNLPLTPSKLCPVTMRQNSRLGSPGWCAVSWGQVMPEYEQRNCRCIRTPQKIFPA